MTKKDAERVMKKLEIEEVSCKHHYRGFLVVEGVRVLAVHRSFGDGPMPGPVVHLFRKSLKLSLPDFQQLVGCTLGRAAYVEQLREQGLVPSPAAKGER